MKPEVPLAYHFVFVELVLLITYLFQISNTLPGKRALFLSIVILDRIADAGKI